MNPWRNSLGARDAFLPENLNRAFPEKGITHCAINTATFRVQTSALQAFSVKQMISRICFAFPGKARPKQSG
jgi:hypothetical protein